MTSPKTLARCYRFFGSMLWCIIFYSWVTAPGYGWQTQTTESKTESGAIRVMSFNIRFGTARDGDNHWKKRHQLVIDAIQDFDPDLLGTQETLSFQADYLKQNLTGYEYVGWSRGKDPQKGEHCGILFRKKRFEKVKAGQFWLSETPDKVASKSWDSSLPRIATWVVLKDKANGGQQFLFLNTHFDHRGSQARLESAKVISKWIKKNHASDSIIITGDFNCGTSSKPYQVFFGKDSKWTDTYRAQNPKVKKNEGTFNGFKGTKTGSRIDWVLHCGQFKTKSASINDYNKNGRYPSDHFPVTATIMWNRRASK